MNDASTNEDAWFYTLGGQRNGPVPADKLRELLEAQAIDGQTPIWCKGMVDWQPLHSTEIGAELKGTPPPIATNQINNGLVWALAFAPIAYLFVDVALLNYQNSHPRGDIFFEAFLSPLTWLVPVTTNAILCLVDAEQLKRAGYSSNAMTIFALLLAPVYLFIRAQRLRQTPTYGFVWVATFIVSIVLRAA
jgi:GYF domain 2